MAIARNLWRGKNRGGGVQVEVLEILENLLLACPSVLEALYIESKERIHNKENPAKNYAIQNEQISSKQTHLTLTSVFFYITPFR